MKSRTILSVLAVIALMSSSAFSASYQGIGWIVPDSTAQAATLANANAQSGNPNNVTFTVTGLQFDSRSGGNNAANYTIQSFLNSLGDLVPGSDTYSGTATSSTILSTGLGGTSMLFEFTGTANFSSNQSFTIAHDDGLQFYIGCTPSTCTSANLFIDDGGPTSPTVTTGTYTGADGTGNQNFVVVYGECCGAPAVFTTSLVPASSATPEPSTDLMLISGLMTTAGLIRRRRRG